MNKRQRRVFNLLRTKTKAIGLNRKELESLAQKIDKNLELEESASDEEIDAAAEDAIEAALPFLEVSQSVAQRSIQTSLQRFRDKHGLADDDEEDDDDDDDVDDTTGNSKQRGKSKKNAQDTDQVNSEILKLIKGQNEVIKELKGQIESMQGDRVTDSRRTKLRNLVKNTGTFGKTVMKQFDLMTFKDDDAFDDYLADVQQDLDELNQERANEGLKKLGEVPTGERRSPEQQTPDVMSDEDIINLAGGTPQNQNK